MCQDMTSFYVYFEASLAPLFILIGLYGAANKDKAADYVLIYTLFSSLFMLLGIALYEVILDNTDYQATSLLVLSLDLQCILFLAISIGIAVKTPLAPLHTWLPVVHSESPLAGSILLAGVILKLAVYAIIRLILPTLSDASVLYTPFVYVLCVITIIYTSIITLRQTDLKVIVAYSSIGRIGPLNIKKILTQQTICRKLKDLLYYIYKSFHLSTNYVSNNYFINMYPFKYEYHINTSSLLVKIFYDYLSNPQIMYALCLLNRISEAIRLLFFTLLFHRPINWLWNRYKYLCLFISLSNKNTSNFTSSSNIYQYKLNEYPSLKIRKYFNHKIAIRYYSLSTKNKEIADKKFYEWLAGLIDGDGYFYYRKINDLTSLTITFDLKNEKTAYMVKNRIGGKIQLINGINVIKFKLHKYENIISLINNINGNIRTINRIEQFKKVCSKYDIKYIEPIKLEYYNGWYSGFFDSDGSISFNKANGNINICITQKNRDILDLLAEVYDGKVYSHDKTSSCFCISKQSAILDLLNNYFHAYPSRTLKFNRLMLLNKYYNLRFMKAHLALEGSLQNKAWSIFLDKWNSLR